jgi:hypothetical protein
MVLTGAACLLGAVAKNGNIARAGVCSSAVVTLVLAVGLTIGIIAVWVGWSQAVGWDQAWKIMLNRPETYPPQLLQIYIAPPSPFLPLVMLAVTVKDFTMCAQPLRVPLEERAGDPQPRPA